MRPLFIIFMSERNNVLTASRITTFLSCQRKHYWQYEVGLRKTEISLALRFGSAWARAMEARWRGASFDEALAIAIHKGTDLDAIVCETISALLGAYYSFWGDREVTAKMHPESQFAYPYEVAPFELSGKLDCLGEIDDQQKIIEGKTTRKSVAPDSTYWLRLKFNVQLLQYYLAARQSGWDVSEVLYDVVRKPSIRPKKIWDVDRGGLKIVVDARGKRVYKANGQPRETGSEKDGWVAKSHIESAEEFGERLFEDIMARPEFYFARKTYPILDGDVESFEIQRSITAKMILLLRGLEDMVGHPSDAWPRNVGENTCTFCQYQSFCLHNLRPDLDHPFDGFEVRPFNPELEKYDDEPTTEEATDGDQQ